MGDETWEIEIAGENVVDKIEIVGEKWDSEIVGNREGGRRDLGNRDSGRECGRQNRDSGRREKQVTPSN